MTCAAAKFTASRPEAQKRLIWTPGTDVLNPAFMAAKRAMSPPASRRPDRQQPSTTSSTLSAVSRPLRSLSAFSERGLASRQRRDFVQGAVGLAFARAACERGRR
jgi:hypothetical protein